MNGFTMIELMMIITLTGILAVVAQPFLPSGEAGLRAAFEKLRSDIWLAQQKALVTGIPHGLSFNQDSYIIYQTTPETPIIDPTTQATFSENLLRFGDSLNILNATQIEFSETGEATQGAGSVIGVSDGTQQKTLRIIASTGTIQEIP